MEICESTCCDRQQWFLERQNRITASNFGKVMQARSEESLKNLASQIQKPLGELTGGKRPLACQIGLMEEGNAKKAYIKYQREVMNRNVSVTNVGLCVPDNSPQTGSTPDGIVHVQGELFPHILEIKCVVDDNPRPLSIVELARQRGSRFYCTVDSADNLELKKNHAYYYQVLGQMATTGLLVADFVIYHPRTLEIKVLRINFDDEDWKKVKSKLDSFVSKYLKT